MKLIYNSQTDRKELNSLIQDWILLRKGDILSGTSCRVLFNNIYGIDIDHHEYAYVLDHLCSIKAVEHYDHNWGDTQYRVL